MAYGPIQRILETAGLSQVVAQEVPTPGVGDGANRLFTVTRTPLSDNNYDGNVDASDVTAYVNGSPVTVDTVDAVSGAVTLHTAPLAAASVAITYRYSSVTMAAAQDAQEAADDAIDQALATVKDRPTTSPSIRKIERWYAAALLITDDYGFQADTQGMSKDAKARLDQAQSWLDAYVAMLVEQATHPEPEDYIDAATANDPDVFPTYDRDNAKFSGTLLPTEDDRFMLGLDFDA